MDSLADKIANMKLSPGWWIKDRGERSFAADLLAAKEIVARSLKEQIYCRPPYVHYMALSAVDSHMLSSFIRMNPGINFYLIFALSKSQYNCYEEHGHLCYSYALIPKQLMTEDDIGSRVNRVKYNIGIHPIYYEDEREEEQFDRFIRPNKKMISGMPLYEIPEILEWDLEGMSHLPPNLTYVIDYWLK